MKQIKQAFVLWTTLLAVVMTSACEPPPSPVPSRDVSWYGLENGLSVYGTVRLTVKVDSDDVIRVMIYDGSPDGRLLGEANAGDDSLYRYDWHTQQTSNVEHTVYARASFKDGDSSQTSLTVMVKNQSRASSIPANVVKMTPSNDAAPPQLAPAFKDYWHDPVPMESPINTAGAEDSPFITPDGNTFYFWFNGDESKDVHEQVKDPLTGIYWSKKVNGRWQEPERLFLQYFDKLGFDGAPTVRGNTLWFVSIREGNYRDMDIWTAELIDGKWVNWTNAGELLNKAYGTGELHVTADGSEIYFSSTRPGGKGEGDIWVTRRVNGQWQEPENIGPVNTTESEGQPFVSEDGNELWFTRLTPGPTVYRSIKIDSKWQEPELIVSNLAGEPTLDSAGNLYFVHHRWDDTLNRVTEADIYVSYRK